MPFIKIKSMEPTQAVDIGDVVVSIGSDFSSDLGIDIEHITVTWEYFSANHYAVAGKVVKKQPKASHPILVDMLVPDFNDAGKIQRMLESVASSISAHTSIPKTNIFINLSLAHSGQVYFGGDIVEW